MARITGAAVRAVMVEAGARGSRRLARAVAEFLNQHGIELASVIDAEKLCVATVYDERRDGAVIVVGADDVEVEP